MVNTEEELKELISDNGYEDVVIFSNPAYASAFIGISDDNRAVYSYEKMCESYMRETGCDLTSAIEWIEYNALGSIVGSNVMPIVIHELTS